MKKYILIIFLFPLLAGESFGQCNDKLVEIAKDSIGDNGVYIQNFKVKLKARRNEKKPIPKAAFNIVLSGGLHYRLNIESAKEFKGVGILKLYKNGNMFATTYVKGKNYKKFDIICKETASYRIEIYFEDGKEGCAVGILSLIGGLKPMNISNKIPIGINGREGGFITKEEILENPVVKVLDDNQAYKVKFFNVSINKTGKYFISYSDSLTDEQLREINKLKFSDKFIVKNVLLESDSGNINMLKSVEFQIIEAQNEQNLLLYTNNENIVEVTSTLAGNENLDVTIDKGRIEGDKGNYSIWIEEEGVVNMFVVAKNAQGEVVETDSVKLQAIEMKPIYANFYGKNGGILRKHEIVNKREVIQLEFRNKKLAEDYKIQSFYVSKDRRLLTGIKSETGNLTNRQIRFIQGLQSGEVFYVKDIVVKTPLNNIIRLETLGFIIE